MAYPFRKGIFLHIVYEDGDEMLCRVKGKRKYGRIAVEVVGATWTDEDGDYANENANYPSCWWDRIISTHDLTEHNRAVPTSRHTDKADVLSWSIVEPKDLPLYAGFKHVHAGRYERGLQEITQEG